MTPLQLLTILVYRYDCREPPNMDEQQKKEWTIKTLKIRLRIAGVLKNWLMKKGYEFDNPEILEKLNKLLSVMKTSKSLEKIADSLIKILNKSSQQGFFPFFSIFFFFLFFFLFFFFFIR